MEGAVDQENIVYGRNAVLELLREKPGSIEKIYFQFNTTHPKLKEILITARRQKLITGKARLEKLSLIAGTTKHQGVCALSVLLPIIPLRSSFPFPATRLLFLLFFRGLTIRTISAPSSGQQRQLLLMVWCLWRGRVLLSMRLSIRLRPVRFPI